MIELLPCPFCGGDAEMDTQRGYVTMDGSRRIDSAVAIYCTRCSADHSICRADHPGVDTEVLVAEITEAWNKRAALPHLSAAPEGGQPLSANSRGLVRNFAAELGRKLRAAEEKYGYRDGWLTQDWEAECLQHMHNHIAKGDPRDVAIYCAFMWAHGWKTAPAHDGVNTKMAKALRDVLAWADQANPAGYGGLPDKTRKIVETALAAQATAGGVESAAENPLIEQLKALFAQSKTITNREQAELLALASELHRPSPALASSGEREKIARALLDRRGFGFYTDPMEGGQDAYDITLEALADADAVLALPHLTAAPEGWKAALEAARRHMRYSASWSGSYAQFQADTALVDAALVSRPISGEREKALIARIEFLEGTLQPFSDAAVDAEGYPDDHAVGCDPQMELSIEIDEGAFGPLTVVHLRRAQRALTAPSAVMDEDRRAESAQ